MRALIIPTDAAPYEIDAKIDATTKVGPLVKAIHDIVDEIVGGDAEHVLVYCTFPGTDQLRYLDMFVNEIGQDLPVNLTATAIYRNNVIVNDLERVMVEGGPNALPAVFGPAVLFEERIWR